MKSILVINFFHSSQEKVGALRTQRFVRYFPQFGWKPWVITKPPWNGKQEEWIKTTDSTFYAPSLPLNKPLHLEVFTWIPFMFARAIWLLIKQPIQVVLFSCPPFHPAVFGIFLKKWFHFKLVIDYRDAWSLNPYYRHLDRFHQWILKGDRILEESLLRKTDLLIVTHPSMKNSYLNKFKYLKNRIEVIYNGFDPERIESKTNSLFPKFSLLHLGDFYAKQKTRDPDIFLKSTQQLVSQKEISPDKFQILFVGKRYSEVEKTIQTSGLSAYVSCLGHIPYEMAIYYLNRSHMLLLIETGEVMTTKVYEYLATGKPILCLIKQGGDLDSFIKKFSINSTIIYSNSVDEIKESIWKCYEDYQKGEYRSSVNEEFKNSFNRMEQTKHLAEFLNEISLRKSSAP